MNDFYMNMVGSLVWFIISLVPFFFILIMIKKAVRSIFMFNKRIKL